jgi:hypothetical protein
VHLPRFQVVDKITTTASLVAAVLLLLLPVVVEIPLETVYIILVRLIVVAAMMAEAEVEATLIYRVVSIVLIAFL